MGSEDENDYIMVDNEENDDEDNSFIHEIHNENSSDASCSTTGEEECENWESQKILREVLTEQSPVIKERMRQYSTSSCASS